MTFVEGMNLVGAVIVSIGGASVIIFALSSWLGKVWANRIMQNEKQAFKKSFEAMKEDFQRETTKREMFHQISQKCYEGLFSKKVETYTSLIKQKTEYSKTIHQDETFELHDYPPRVYHNYFIGVQKIIDANRLYISNELSAAFDTLYFKISPYIRASGILKAYGEESNQHWEDIAANQDEKLTEMISKTSNELDAFNKQIDNDVDELRKWIDVAH